MPELLRPAAVITGHSAADYDALAAMVAASKLYPEAVLVAPSLLERHSSHAFTESLFERFNFKKPAECDFSQVSLLVVVDTRQATRVDHVKPVLENPGLRIHIYDHHPPAAGDLPAEYADIRPLGSTTTIITEHIKNKGLSLTPDEASMLGLGIFEDTGSFGFSSAAPEDFQAAAFLRAQGMDVELITEIISSDLTREQVHILDTLLRNAVTHTIQGIPVTVTELHLENFVGDIASLAHKLMDMENLKVLFTVAGMGDRVQLIARSRLPEVDAGKICASFGGGGHSYAAAAAVRGRPVAEVKAQLMAYLVAGITPQMTVGKHMTAPAVTVDDTQPIAQADEVMIRFGLKAVPVLDAQTKHCIGILEQQTAARAVSHKLGGQPLTEYMLRGAKTLSPEADLYQAMEIILKDRQRLIPVEENGHVTGVLTRTDIIRLLIDESLHIPEGAALAKDQQERNIAANLRDQLPPSHLALLETAGKLADEMGLAVFAVGGFVRDLLLRRENLDIDLSVEGDGIAFAGRLAELLHGRVRIHNKFKTAIVFYKDEKGEEQHLDVATARLEYYEYPAALPTVELSSIKMDLYRRDFTINALAVQLNSSRFGILVDPFGAQRDIKEKSITVLHSLSFVEDPTRILRAVRFERRFNFQLSRQTERLIKNALSLGMMDKLSGARIFNELKHVFDEKDVPSCLRRMESWNLLHLIHPMLKLVSAKDVMTATMDEVLAWYRLLYKDRQPRNWVAYMLVLCANAKYLEVNGLLERLGFIERAKNEFQQLREYVRRASGRLAEIYKKQGQAPLSLLHETLNPVPVEGLLYLMARHGHEHNIGEDISLYLTRLKDAKADIGGADLERLGGTPGPVFSDILKKVLYAKLDGTAFSRDEQISLAVVLLEEAAQGPQQPDRRKKPRQPGGLWPERRSSEPEPPIYE